MSNGKSKKKEYLSTKKQLEKKNLEDDIANKDATSSIQAYFHEAEEYPTQSVDAILEQLQTMEVANVASEVLDWLIENVENYIDNKQQYFQIDLIIDENNNSESVKNIKLLQTLYRSIPENDERATECREKINLFTEDVLACMDEDMTDKLEKLFKRMSFYYEMKGISKEKGLLIQELTGSVSIVDFVYEAFSLGVRNSQINPFTRERKVLKEIVLPEAFTVGVEIAFNTVDSTRSLF